MPRKETVLITNGPATRTKCMVGLLIPLLLWGTSAQTESSTNATRNSSSEDAQITFQALADLVVLPINVTDATGDFVPNLTPDNFQVFEDGRPQKIKLFEREDLPVTVGLIVDHSRSMEDKLPSVAAAISKFAYSSNPQDEMFVVDFSDKVWPELFHGQTFTSNPKELEGALMAVAAEGETALYDAVYEGLQRLRSGHRKKRALIIVSDGGDNASRHKYAEVLSLAHEAQVIVYSIGLIVGSGEEEKPRVLQRLSKDTGGLCFFPHSIAAVAEASNRIARDLRQQYTIAYVPARITNSVDFHRIEVKVSASGHGRLHVRTRLGYSVAKIPSVGELEARE